MEKPPDNINDEEPEKIRGVELRKYDEALTDLEKDAIEELNKLPVGSEEAIEILNEVFKQYEEMADQEAREDKSDGSSGRASIRADIKKAVFYSRLDNYQDDVAVFLSDAENLTFHLREEELRLKIAEIKEELVPNWRADW